MPVMRSSIIAPTGNDGRVNRRRGFLLVYGALIAFFLLWAGYSKGRTGGESAGLAALSSLIAVLIVLGIMAGAAYFKRARGVRAEDDPFEGLHPGEGRQPPGWWWDEASGRWRKPPRPS